MAFHPSWATNHQAFVSFTEGSPLVSVIARFTSNDGGATLNASTRQNVIRVNQPYTNHNGGNIAFGPDGNLYIGFGDGGDGGDPQGHGQNTTDVLGDVPAPQRRRRCAVHDTGRQSVRRERGDVWA